MNKAVVLLEGVSKRYRLGQIDAKSAKSDVKEFYDTIRGRHSQYHAGRSNRDSVWAVRDVDIDVRSGEVLSIIGRNGAGKSTLLKIMSRISAPTEGAVKTRGRVCSLLEAGTGFHPELTGRENVFLSGAVLGVEQKALRAAIDSILKFAEIGSYVDTPVKRYSSGMAVRLAFAIAVHSQPDILLVDEVLAVGDRAFQAKCLEKIEELRRGGCAIVFVSHNMHLVERCSSRVAVMAGGELAFVGDPVDGVKRYLEICSREERTPILCTNDGQGLVKSIVTMDEVIISDKYGRKSSVFQSGEPFVVFFKYSIFQEIDAPIFSISLWSLSEGVRLGTSLSVLDLMESEAQLPGYYTVSCLVESLELMPGRYFLRGGVFESRLRYPYSLWGWDDEAPVIEIKPVERNGFLMKAELGLMRIPGNWTVQKVA